MAYLQENEEWAEGIYRIELTDPVIGGEDGISNIQAKQLGGRTLHLKQEIEAAQSELRQEIEEARGDLLDAFGKGTPIPIGTDLNTIITPGRYYTQTEAVDDGILNYPASLGNRAFVLDVLERPTTAYPDGDINILQIVRRQSAVMTWERRLLGDTWTAWNRFLTDTADTGLLSPVNGGVGVRATVNGATGAVSHARNIVSVTRTGTGTYNIVWSPAINDATPVVTTNENDVFNITVTNWTSTSCTVGLRSKNDVLVDGNFWIAVV